MTIPQGPNFGPGNRQYFDDAPTVVFAKIPAEPDTARPAEPAPQYGQPLYGPPQYGPPQSGQQESGPQQSGPPPVDPPPGDEPKPDAPAPKPASTTPATKPKQFKATMKRLLGLLKPHKIAVFVVVLSTIGSISLSVAVPKILGHVTDLIFAGFIGKSLPAGISRDEAAEAIRASGNSTFADLVQNSADVVPGVGLNFDAIGKVILVAIGVYVMASLLAWVEAFLLNIIVQKTIYKLRAEVEAKIHRLPLPYFDRTPRGEVLSRVTNDIDNVSSTLSQTLTSLLTSVLTVVGVLTMMFVISPMLSLIALIAVPVSVVLVARVAKRAQVLFKAQWEETGKINAQIEETYSGRDLVRVYGHQIEAEREFAVQNKKLLDASFGAQFLSSLIMPVMNFVGNITYVLLAVVGALKVASGNMSLGDVQAFIVYSRQFSSPLTQIASMSSSLQSGAASAERVFELLDEPEQTPDIANPVLPEQAGRHRTVGTVVFENVSFRYDKDVPLIENVNLTAESGQTVAIVGPTGAGKTTLVNLIMRFYEVDSGRITIDDVDIAHMRRADLRSHVGMVLQDTWLFGGTIRENIAYGRIGASEAEIQAAARAAFADRFIHTLPDGYDTVLDEEASNISSGEKQLITIARAFLSEPSLLILDEATSSVDTRTEQLVQHAMSALRAGRTSFIIAHRLSTIRNADLIVVMEAGQIVEQGTHDQLIAHGGAYFRLYNAQFEGAAV
ncbi:ABC transporter transmembrane domain-containing protein [Rhodococcus globerulus]|uniref:ABC transporter transmembrane domain-containing protein n=1 Tax=Rhodococcus globerulus TaxID=33008 RepID=A0ABU4BVS8_RHOGO|nr:ABC transporter transmembrane domain-containing protein [Rhodococcus globerulus]MDV6268321.1 ABC transporter transmembrane domain-containing protein [Rhodococcus globerulus]